MFLGLFFTLVAQSAAFADIAPPAGTKYCDPRVRFIGIQKYPDYTFTLEYKTGHDLRDPFFPETIAVKNDRAFTIPNTQRFFGGTALIATRKDRAPNDGKGNESALRELRTNIPAPTNMTSVWSLRGPLTEYRVSFKDGTLQVEPVKKERSQASVIGMPSGAAGLTLALSLTGIGLWCTRRR
jgi:hypothetical protein